MSIKRINVLAICLLSLLTLPMQLLAAPPAKAAPSSAQTEYYAIYADGKKVGQSEETRVVEGGKVTTTNHLEMMAGRGAMSINVSQETVCVETEQGKPLSFKSSQDMSLMSQNVEGTIKPDGTMTVVSDSGGGQTTRTMPWPAGALLSEGLRLYRLSKGFTPGTTYSGSVFETTSLQPVEFKTVVGSKRQVDLVGRKAVGIELRTTSIAPSGSIESVDYVDNQGKLLKTSTTAVGTTMEIVSCTQEVAQTDNSAMDLMQKTILHSPSPLPGVGGARQAVITLVPTGKGKLTVPTLPNQRVIPGAGGKVTITTSVVPVPQGASFPNDGGTSISKAATQPTRYLECDRKEVVDLARQAVGDTKDAGQAAHKIEQFVRSYIHSKDLSVGYASAAEVVASREGDCTEHAVLVAAMCRAVGIPAQVVSGMVYVPAFQEQRDVFGPHAWVRAMVGSQWINLDAALPGGWDVSHIALAYGDGNPTDFMGMINTLGNFKIGSVQLRK